MAKADRMQWSVAQRCASFVKSSIVLFIVGLVSSILGVGVINCLVAIKTLIGSHASEIALSQEVLAISVAHGVYMATSGNIRYQILAGIVEERGIDRIFAHRQSVLKALTFIIRSVNTYYGSAHWIVFIRLLGLQDE